MLTNAAIKRIDVAGEPDVANQRTYTEGSAIDHRVAVDDPMTSQKWVPGAEVKDATAVVYLKAEATAPAIRKGDRLLVRIDTEAADRPLLQVYKVNDRILRGVSHQEIYLGQPIGL